MTCVNYKSIRFCPATILANISISLLRFGLCKLYALLPKIALGAFLFLCGYLDTFSHVSRVIWQFLALQLVVRRRVGVVFVYITFAYLQKLLNICRPSDCAYPPAVTSWDVVAIRQPDGRTN